MTVPIPGSLGQASMKISGALLHSVWYRSDIPLLVAAIVSYVLLLSIPFHQSPLLLHLHVFMFSFLRSCCSPCRSQFLPLTSSGAQATPQPPAMVTSLHSVEACQLVYQDPNLMPGLSPFLSIFGIHDPVQHEIKCMRMNQSGFHKLSRTEWTRGPEVIRVQGWIPGL